MRAVASWQNVFSRGFCAWDDSTWLLFFGREKSEEIRKCETGPIYRKHKTRRQQRQRSNRGTRNTEHDDANELKIMDALRDRMGFEWTL